jgi:hypothetical protein
VTAGDEVQNSLVELRELAQLPEHQFVSRTPVLGRFIAAFRTAWNNVSTRWYVQPIRQQQTQFNQLTVDQLEALRRDLAALHEWVIAQDHEQTERSHDLGELALQLGQMRRRLDCLPANPPDTTEGPRTEDPTL